MCKRYIDQLPLACPQLGNSARNPGMCPDWESTSDISAHRPALNPLSHTSHGEPSFNTIQPIKRGKSMRVCVYICLSLCIHICIHTHTCVHIYNYCQKYEESKISPELPVNKLSQKAFMDAVRRSKTPERKGRYDSRHSK